MAANAERAPRVGGAKDSLRDKSKSATDRLVKVYKECSPDLLDDESVKLQPGVIVFRTIPTQQELFIAREGIFARPEFNGLALDFFTRLFGMLSLPKPGPSVRAGVVAGVAKPQAPYYHCRALARRAYTTVVRQLLINEYQGDWEKHLCGGGAAVSGRQYMQWRRDENDDSQPCGCGDKCRDALERSSGQA